VTNLYGAFLEALNLLKCLNNNNISEKYWNKIYSVLCLFIQYVLID